VHYPNISAACCCGREKRFRPRPGDWIDLAQRCQFAVHIRHAVIQHLELRAPLREQGSGDGGDGIAASSAGLHCSLVRHHGFQDGNTRTARACRALFLQWNGVRPCIDAAGVVLTLARGAISAAASAASRNLRTDEITGSQLSLPNQRLPEHEMRSIERIVIWQH